MVMLQVGIVRVLQVQCEGLWTRREVDVGLRMQIVFRVIIYVEIIVEIVIAVVGKVNLLLLIIDILLVRHHHRMNSVCERWWTKSGEIRRLVLCVVVFQLLLAMR